MAGGLQPLQFVKRFVQGALERNLVSRQHAHFLSPIAIEDGIWLVLSVKQEGLHRYQAAESPSTRYNALHQKEFEFSYGRELRPQALSKLDEV
jgi:hypothetical protein